MVKRFFSLDINRLNAAVFSPSKKYSTPLLTIRQTLDKGPRGIKFLRERQETGAAGGSSALLLGHSNLFFVVVVVFFVCVK